MNNSINFFVNESDKGERIDIYLSKSIENLTRSHIQKLIKKNYVKLNEITINLPSIKIKTKDKISVKITQERNKKIIPYNFKLEVIYEDKDLLVINKPKGLVVHPGPGNYKNTLVNALVFKYKNNLSDINGDLRPGIVHRIDKETSGLLVVAKNNISHSKLSEQFSNHTISRKYQCLVWGVIRPMNGRIQTLITRNKKNRQLMTVSDLTGKTAITNYKTLKVFDKENIPKISLLECTLETGRTHQIRVHLKYKGTSILGDNQYGKGKIKFKKIDKSFYSKLIELTGQLLHAKTLEFKHPTKNKIVNFNSNLPTEFKKMLKLLNNPNS
tara:strand:+ start:72 stop:1052 length:981 start_codon:yes stop_codon:yes gene_type:complete